MLLNVYAIYDSKARIYQRPFYMLNHDMVRRACLDILAVPDHDITKHKADYAVFHLGTFDDSNARFDNLAAPRVMFGFHEIQMEADV